MHTSEQLDKLPNIRKSVREEEEFQQKAQEKERKEQEKADKRKPHKGLGDAIQGRRLFGHIRY